MPRFGIAAIALNVLVWIGWLGCDARTARPVGADSGAAAAECPACNCVCDCAKEGAVPATTTTAPRTDVSDLVESANRKMNHGDGKGCMADLEQVAELDPKMDKRLAVTRGQCEMLIGQCSAGKRRIAEWYVTETGVTPERAAMTAESLGSMRCRGGDSSERDRLLVALFNLSDGAYMNPRSAEFCRENVETAKRLLPRVKPTGPDDGQISGGGQALFHTAAACFARAGDCKSSFAIYRELFPASGLAALPDAKMRDKVIRDSFDSSIERCKGKVP